MLASYDAINNLPEIKAKRFDSQVPFNRPDAIAKFFEQKLNVLMDLFTNYFILAANFTHMCTIERKKCGLSHVHILP